jgi:hypothetical protein
MSLIKRRTPVPAPAQSTPKPAPEPVTEPKPLSEAQREAIEGAERRARVEAIEKAEADTQAARIEKNKKDSEGMAEEYFGRLAERQAQAQANKPITIPAAPDPEVLRKAEHKSERVGGDSLMEKEPEYVQKMHGYTPFKPKPSITLQPKPNKYPAGDPRHDLDEALVVSLGMDPNPQHNPFPPKK